MLPRQEQNSDNSDTRETRTFCAAQVRPAEIRDCKPEHSKVA